MESTRHPGGQYFWGQQYNTLLTDHEAASQLHTHQQLGAIAMPTNPSNGQTLTLTISGTAIVFTFVSSLGATAGNVLIGGSTAATLANLMALLQNPQFTTSTGVALTQANQKILSYCGYALPSGTTTITVYSVNSLVWAPQTSFTASTTVTGASYTAQTMQLFVEVGRYFIGTVRVAFFGGSTPTFTAPVSNPRIDLVCIDNTGTLSIVQGTENASPVAPTYPKDKIVLVEVMNVVGETALYDTQNKQSGQGYIQYDVRPYLLLGKYISQTSAEIFVPTDSGSANTYVGTTVPAIPALTDGLIISFRATHQNTGASTFNLNSLGAKTIKKGASVDLSAGDIQAGALVVLQYDLNNTYWQMVSMLGNLPVSFVSTGADGSLTFDGTTTILGMAPSSNIYTLTRDIYAINITINSGVTLKTNGYAIYWTGTFTNNGVLSNVGGAGGAGGAASGATQGTAGTAGSALTNGTLKQGIPGQAGGLGGANSAGGGSPTAGANGTAGTGTTNSLGVSGVAGSAGGTGGGSGFSFAGALGGSGGGGGTATPATQGPYQASQLLMFGSISLAVITPYQGSAGSGAGGGGGGGGTNSGGSNSSGAGGGGGGSGAPGGIMLLIGNILINNGTITAVGGAGGNGGAGADGSFSPFSNNTGGGGGGGGGSGGDGGVIVIAAFSYINNGTTTVAGGTAGTGGVGGHGFTAGSGTPNPSFAGATGTNGNAGATGTILSIPL